MLRAAAFCAGLALAAHQAAAQTLAVLTRRLDSVHAEAIAAGKALEAHRFGAPQRGAAWEDSVVIAGGRVKLYFNRELSEVAKAGARRADDQLQQFGAALVRLPEQSYSVVPDTALTPYDRRDRQGMVNVRFHPAWGEPNHTSAPPTADAVASVMVSRASELIVNSTSPLRDWRRGSLPLDTSARTRADWAELRLTAVSSPSFRGSECLAGVVRSCRLFLRLDSVADPVTELYDAAGRRSLVAQHEGYANRSAQTAARACLAGDDHGCISVLRLMDVAERVLEFDHLRASLLSHALVIGGDHAAERLLQTKGSAADALAAAAGRPLDELLLDWQRNLRGRRGASGLLSFPIVFSSILWVAACVVLAMRSSRWR